MRRSLAATHQRRVAFTCHGPNRAREDSGYWTRVKRYLQAHTAADFSHGLCPDCLRRLYPKYADEPEPPARPPDGPA